MRNIRNFLFNGLFICLVSLIMRTINVSFNIYVSNTAGAEAMGLFSLLSGVYGFSLTLATSGIQVTTVRLVSEAIGARDLNRAQTALKKCILYSLFFGSFASFGLFFGADFIGKNKTYARTHNGSFGGFRCNNQLLWLVSVVSSDDGHFESVGNSLCRNICRYLLS